MELSAPTSKKVVVFDYGFGNVRSAERALARALRYASERDPRAAGILPSTKGAL